LAQFLSVVLHKLLIPNGLRLAGPARQRNLLIYNTLCHRSLSRVSSNFSHAARYIFAKPSRFRRDALSARRLKKHDKRNRFFLAIRLNVIILFFKNGNAQGKPKGYD